MMLLYKKSRGEDIFGAAQNLRPILLINIGVTMDIARGTDHITLSTKKFGFSKLCKLAPQAERWNEPF